jgi:uncharacterized protein
VGVSGLTGLSQRIRFSGTAAWVAGAVSGILGGLVGNQGGIRSGAMLGLGVPKEAFVATVTAIGLLVDMARLPVYLVAEGPALSRQWQLLGIATVGVLVGTLVGRPLLKRVSEEAFRAIVAALVLLLGMWMLGQAVSPRT